MKAPSTLTTRKNVWLPGRRYSPSPVWAAAKRADTEPFASELAQAMVMLGGNPELRRKFGQASLQRVKDRFV